MIHIKNSLYIIAAAFLLLFSVSIVHAHGSGASVETTINGYFIDIGYSPEDVASGRQVRFDFVLQDENLREDVSFTDLWLKISDEDTVFFAGSIAKARFGGTGVSYVFAKEGEYELSVRFQDGPEELVEVQLPFNVKKGASEGTFDAQFLIVLALGVLALGLVAGFGRKFYKK